MVSFELTDDQREIRDWVHEFAEREIRPVAAHYDEIEEFPWEVVRKAAEVGPFSAPEANAGSDVSSYKTHAVKSNGDWIINGEKVFITNGGIADVHVVVATVDPALGSRGHASFVVPPKTAGLSQGKKEKK